MEHIISTLVENKFGVLARVAGLFSARGYNIESLSVASTLDPATSMITIVTVGDDQIIEQIIKQLRKLVNVIKVTDLHEGEYLARELILAKVSATEQTKPEILRLVDIFRGKVVDVSPKTYTLEISGDEAKLRAVLELLRPLGLKEIVRTGKIAMPRGMQGASA